MNPSQMNCFLPKLGCMNTPMSHSWSSKAADPSIRNGSGECINGPQQPPLCEQQPQGCKKVGLFWCRVEKRALVAWCEIVMIYRLKREGNEGSNASRVAKIHSKIKQVRKLRDGGGNDSSFGAHKIRTTLTANQLGHRSRRMRANINYAKGGETLELLSKSWFERFKHRG